MIICRLAISSLCMLTALGSMFIRSTRTLGSESLASSRAQSSQPETSAKRISVARDKIQKRAYVPSASYPTAYTDTVVVISVLHRERTRRIHGGFQTTPISTVLFPRAGEFIASDWTGVTSPVALRWISLRCSHCNGGDDENEEICTRNVHGFRCSA